MSIRYRGKRLYLLFVHYGVKADLDAEEHELEEYVRKLVRDLNYLHEIVQGKKHEIWQGYAFVFLEQGWIDLLSRRPEVQPRIDLARHLGIIDGFLLANMRQEVRKWVRLVTVHHLGELFDRLEQAVQPEISKDAIWTFLAGGQEKLLYDAPKVVEAAIRIANIGRNAPVLRFDDDVIFYGSRLYDDHPQIDKENGQRKAAPFTRQQKKIINFTRRKIRNLCNHYKRLSEIPEISYFVFSGSYLEEEVSKMFESGTLANERNYHDCALNGFSTRILQLAEAAAPAQRFKEMLLSHRGFRGFEESLRLNWEENDRDTQEKMESMLKEIGVDVDINKVSIFLRELYKYGANPFLQVISGAGLCLSDGAILDLPPFSNMRKNVLWIDDHIKYSLHHELRHFGFLQGTAQAARATETWFKQERHKKAGPAAGPSLYDVRWHVRRYMPRFILGCVADSWLRATDELKLRNRNWPKRRFDDMIDKIAGPGSYAEFFSEQVAAKVRKDTRLIKDHLRECALRRLASLVDFFHSFDGTFLQILANKKHGSGKEGHHLFDQFARLGFFPEIAPRGLAAAVEELEGHLAARAEEPGREAGAGEPGKGATKLAQSLNILLDDFINYIEVVNFWRDFVFSVRSLLNRKNPEQAVGWLLPPEKLLRSLVKQWEDSGLSR